jgi:phage-related protein
MAQLSEDQLLAVINAMGNFGAAAEAAARSLSRAANSADSVISSSVRETEAKNELKQQTDKIKNSFGQLGGIITQFSSSIISTTDAVASSNQVFSGISPAITTLTSMISSGLQSVFTIGGAAAPTS